MAGPVMALPFELNNSNKTEKFDRFKKLRYLQYLYLAPPFGVINESATG
jgi:hypothetical protein